MSLIKYQLGHLKFISWVLEFIPSYKVLNGQISLPLSRDAEKPTLIIKRAMISLNTKPCLVSTKSQVNSSNFTRRTLAANSPEDNYLTQSIIPLALFMITLSNKKQTAGTRSASTKSLEDRSVSENASTYLTEFGKRHLKVATNSMMKKVRAKITSTSPTKDQKMKFCSVIYSTLSIWPVN